MTALAWIGQGGYILEHCGGRLVIDPYLSDVVERREGLTRICPRVASVDTLRPDYLFFTHSHLDHYDPDAAPALFATYPACRVMGPAWSFII